MSDSVVEKNKVVSFTYEIWDTDGNMHEKVQEPIMYVHGVSHRLFEQIEEALEGKQVDDEIEVSMSPDEAFGYPDPNMIFTDDIDNVPPEFRTLGAEVEMQSETGESKTFVVSRIEDGQLTIDGNHPLAGKTITFKITISAIRDASSEEIQTGEPEETHPMLH